MGVALRTAAQLRSQRESSSKAASDSKISSNSWSPGAHYDILEDAFPACGVFHVVMQGSALCAGTVVDGTRLALSALSLPRSEHLVCVRERCRWRPNCSELRQGSSLRSILYCPLSILPTLRVAVGAQHSVIIASPTREKKRKRNKI